MIIDPSRIVYEKTNPPVYNLPDTPVELTDKTMAERARKVLDLMKGLGYDTLVIYGDREHGSNFCYLTGFVPRFEEELLVLHSNGEAYLLAGNENLDMATHSRLKAKIIHVPYFSLPNQPMENHVSFLELLSKAKIKKGSRTGIIGWKMFTSSFENNSQLFDVPAFIVSAVKTLVGEDGSVENACDLMISPKYGARTRMNANEIAHYEFGATLAGYGVLKAMEALEPGKTELELAALLENYGALNTVQTICAVGERYTNAVVEPRKKEVQVGDRCAFSVGYRGGLTNRKGYAVHNAEELPVGEQKYLDCVAKPYFAAAATWYSNLCIGISGDWLYECIEEVIPKEKYGWVLNPGHLIGTEEWMSSPIYEGSLDELRSGMMLQMDIIIQVKGYGGINAEDGVALADERLRKEIEKEYPEVWERIQRRRDYMEKELGITLQHEVLPLSDSEGYLRPYLLNRDYALKVGKEK